MAANIGILKAKSFVDLWACPNTLEQHQDEIA
jgi:hypothetical protein